MTEHPDVMAARDPTKSIDQLSKDFPDLGEKFKNWKGKAGKGKKQQS